MEPISLVVAAMAASASLVKVLVEFLESYKKLQKRRRSVIIKRADGTTVNIDVDPSKEESVSHFLTEIQKPKSEGDLGRE